MGRISCHPFEITRNYELSAVFQVADSAKPYQAFSRTYKMCPQLHATCARHAPTVLRAFQLLSAFASGFFPTRRLCLCPSLDRPAVAGQEAQQRRCVRGFEATAEADTGVSHQQVSRWRDANVGARLNANSKTAFTCSRNVPACPIFGWGKKWNKQMRPKRTMNRDREQRKTIPQLATDAATEFCRCR
jgi:hypothetical protein